MKKSFTLVELLVVITIILLMIAAAIGSIDPVGIFNRARDARVKKDLGRIKIAFEDYFNDKGCYPSSGLVNGVNGEAEYLMNKYSCGGRVFSPWLSPWPCDNNRNPYLVLTGYDGNCPKWFKVFAVLENKNDKDIIKDLALSGILGIEHADINYGVSSGNIYVTDDMGTNDPYCIALGRCYYYPEENKCNKIVSGCSGSNCYFGECSARCKVKCCGAGCN